MSQDTEDSKISNILGTFMILDNIREHCNELGSSFNIMTALTFIMERDNKKGRPEFILMTIGMWMATYSTEIPVTVRATDAQHRFQFAALLREDNPDRTEEKVH